MKTPFLLIAVMCSSAVADQFYVTAGIDCGQSRPELVIWFRGAWNETGEKAVSNLGERGIDPRKFVRFSKDDRGNYSSHIKTKKIMCQVGGERYKVVLSPLLAPGFHAEGKCAARIGASAIVRQGRRTIASAGVDGCTEAGRVTTMITLQPMAQPVYKEIDAAEFYGN